MPLGSRLPWHCPQGLVLHCCICPWHTVWPNYVCEVAVPRGSHGFETCWCKFGVSLQSGGAHNAWWYVVAPGLLSKSAPEDCPKTVFHKRVPQECPTRVGHCHKSHKSTAYKSVLQECPTRASNNVWSFVFDCAFVFGLVGFILLFNA